MRIPTILGLSLLIIALVASIGTYLYQKQLSQFQKASLAPRDVTLLNLSPNQASIAWQTTSPAEGTLLFDSNPTKSLADDRGKGKRITHFVTIKDLKPNTKYFYKIKNEDFIYPDQPQDFTTPQTPQGTPPLSTNQNLLGSVIEDLLPAEAVVILSLDGASKIGTYTSQTGNFILPLKGILTVDLKDYFDLKKQTATLLIQKGDKKAEAKLTLPVNRPLPTISFGQNINLDALLASPSPTPLKSFDLNGDGKVNSLDLAIVRVNTTKALKDKKADVNSDGKVDQVDIELVAKAIK